MKMSAISDFFKGALLSMVALAPIVAFLYYKFVLLVKMPWFALPLAIVVWGTMFGVSSVTGSDRRGDITSGVEDLGSVFVVFGSWFVASIMVVAHFI